MAGGEDERKRSRKRRSSPSPDSPRKSRDQDEERRKRSKKDEREKTSRKKEEKKSKSSRERKKGGDGSSKEKKHKSSRKGSNLIEELTAADYFNKNNEFSTWLKEKKGIFFSNLSSTDARDLFSGFIKDWNRGKLDSHYYEGISKGQRTSHNWKIAPEK